MNTTRAVLLIPAVLLGASLGYPQVRPAPAERGIAAAKADETAEAAEAARARAISPSVAAKLSQAMPKYNPPPPQPAPKTDEELAR